jgi:hypothetical protein
VLRARWIVGLVVCAVAAAGVAGCGSSGSSGSPLQTEFSYLPANSPLVLTIQTDPNSAGVKNTMAFLGRFSFAPLLESAVITRLRQAGVDYNADVKPLFGNPVVFAIPAASLYRSGGGRNYVAVWVTKSSSALNSLIQRTSSGLRKLGSRGSATLYGAGGRTAIAVDGATLVVGATRESVIAALDRHAQGGGVSMASYAANTAGLPTDAEIQVFGNVQQLLTGNPRASSALRVPWVAAIRGYGVSIGASSSGTTVRYHVDTTGSSLSPAQLPLSPAAPVPALPTGFPIAAGLQDPQHLITFIESAEQLAAPGKWATFQRRQAALRAKTGTDITALLHQLTGNLVIASNLHATFGRADVADPKATAATLAKLLKDPRDAFQTGTVTRAGNAYVFKKPKGDVILELVGSRLAVGNKTTAAQVHAFASAPTAPAAGAQGPVAFSVALPQLLSLVSRSASTRIPPALISTLGNLTGWASNTASGLNGTASLAFK